MWQQTLKLSVCLCLMIAISSCFMIMDSSITHLDNGDELRNESRDITKEFEKAMTGHWQNNMISHGLEETFKSYIKFSPSTSSRLSRSTGWMVKRTSLKVRNPVNMPDKWEQKILSKFDKDLAAGKPIAEIEHSGVVVEGGRHYFRYMKAIPTTAYCLVCHGPKESLSPEILELLETKYPHDAATGFSEGMIQGAYSVKQPL